MFNNKRNPFFLQKKFSCSHPLLCTCDKTAFVSTKKTPKYNKKKISSIQQIVICRQTIFLCGIMGEVVRLKSAKGTTGGSCCNSAAAA
jgi:hypothetical protein